MSELTAFGKRFAEAGVFALALIGPVKTAEAYEPPGNTWAALMGENVTEREHDIDRLEAECSGLRADIASLEMRLAGNQARYDRDPGLKFVEKAELREAEADLKRKEAQIKRLQEGLERGLAAEADRRSDWSKTADATGMKFLDPTLDLSPRELGSQRIADYYAKYKIGYSDSEHALYFYSDAHGQRSRLVVGPGLVSADAYFTDGGNDLSFVFTTTQETYMTLKLDDGIFDGYFVSDEKGRPLPPSLE